MKESRHLMLVMEEEANIDYRYSDIEEVEDEIGEIIKHHISYQRPRLEVLDNYFKGKNEGIFNRKGRVSKNRSDKRIANPFAKNISTFVQGYTTGNPVKVQTNDLHMKELVEEVGEVNDVDSLNGELMLDLSKYGRAYELVFYGEDEEDKATLLDVENTFVVYKDTVTAEPLCAVHYRLDKGLGSKLSKDEYKVSFSIYTDDEVRVYKKTSLEDFEVNIDEDESKPHKYEEVPIIEYRVDRTRQGDYENVIGLIDAYDSTESDIANFFTDYNESMLTLTGNLGNIDWEGLEDDLSDGVMLTLDGGTDADGNTMPVEASYLIREYDFQGSDTYLNRIKDDIHKHSKVPDMEEQTFAGNISGVAMRYKLIDLEQLMDTKTRALERGLSKRYRLIRKNKNFLNEYNKIESENLTYKWTANMPEAVEEEMKAVHAMGGEFSLDTLYSTVSIIESSDEEKKKLLAEKTGLSYKEVKELDPEVFRKAMSMLRSSTVIDIQEIIDEVKG